MAEYTNLTTLEGLQVGDVVTYTASSATANAIWNVVTKGFKIKVDINAAKTTGPIGQVTAGGKTIANVDCTNINDLTLYTYIRSAGLAYGTYSKYANLLYYRLLVAGAPSTYYSTGYSADGSKGKGGGITGGDGTSGKGGTQTAGGKGYGSYNSDKSGTFGYGGSSDSSGGAGWYGGGGAYGGSAVRGGGGSGFIIGQTTTTYPSGFLGDDTSLQSSLAAAITEGTTTQGGSTATNPYITITILEASAGSTQSTLNYYNGTEFKKCYATYYNGTSFIDCDAYYYDGTEFKKIGGE